MAGTKRERDDKEDSLARAEEDGAFNHQTKKLKFSASSSMIDVANIDSSSPSSSKKVDSGPFFWDGELRQTANAHADRYKDTRPVFRLHDILGEVLTFKWCSQFQSQFFLFFRSPIWISRFCLHMLLKYRGSIVSCPKIYLSFSSVSPMRPVLQMSIIYYPTG